MELKNRLKLLRKQNGYSQEKLADKLGIARQTISKWENGQSVPELSGLISLSNLYGITIDRIVKDDEECNISLSRDTSKDRNKMIEFLLAAKKNTYASSDNQTESCRTNSHDFCYQDKAGFQYYDSYLGGECFSGEFVWFQGYEEIFYMDEKIYECYFHGGAIR